MNKRFVSASLLILALSVSASELSSPLFLVDVSDA
jgi:hypothetical protein